VEKTIEYKLQEGKVIAALSSVYDPEIPVNIHELGLIYNIDVNPDHSVRVTMTLTAPACPVAGTLPGEVEKKVESIDEVKKATVELVWDPPWSRDMMSESALLQLGMY
jgi:FeS assembly SUF system protein